MKTNILIMMVTAAFLLAACGSSKNTSTLVNDDALSVLKPKETTPTQPQIETDVMEAKKQANEEMEEITKQTSEKMEVEEMAMEEKAEEMMKQNTDEVASEALELSALETETLEIDEDKIIDEEKVVEEVKVIPQKNTQNKMDMVGKYKWVKRICCGRMRVVTTPQNGEELFMEITDDGQLMYSGNAQKKAENTTYEMKVNSLTFPDRPMLKIEGKVDAMVSFNGDTLLIDRGYIDLDKNYWLKIKD